MARISSDVLELQYSFLSILELIVRDPLTIIFSLVVMFSFSVKLTLFVLIFIPLSGGVISQIGKSLKRKSDRVQKEQGEFLSLLEETLGGIKIIKAFNGQNTFIKKFNQSTDRFFNFSNKLLNRQNLASPVSEFLGIVVISILLWYGGKNGFNRPNTERRYFSVLFGSGLQHPYTGQRDQQGLLQYQKRKCCCAAGPRNLGSQR